MYRNMIDRIQFGRACRYNTILVSSHWQLQVQFLFRESNCPNIDFHNNCTMSSRRCHLDKVVDLQAHACKIVTELAESSKRINVWTLACHNPHIAHNLSELLLWTLLHYDGSCVQQHITSSPCLHPGKGGHELAATPRDAISEEPSRRLDPQVPAPSQLPGCSHMAVSLGHLPQLQVINDAR